MLASGLFDQDGRELGFLFVFFSFFNLRFSFMLSFGFFRCSLLPLSLLPLSAIFSPF
jgi:hypothetical protein